MPMKIRYRLITRGERGKLFYCVDTETGKRFSLKTKDSDAANQIVLAKNQSLRQPNLNLHIAKAYLAGTWHLGASQRDLANLEADDIAWQQRVIAYSRKKTGSLACIRFGEEIEAILKRLPNAGRCSLIFAP